MLWPAGSQPGKHGVQGAGQGTTEIFVLLISLPFYFFFLIYRDRSSGLVVDAFSLTDVHLLQLHSVDVGDLAPRLGHEQARGRQCCGQERFLFPLWEAGRRTWFIPLTNVAMK